MKQLSLRRAWANGIFALFLASAGFAQASILDIATSVFTTANAHPINIQVCTDHIQLTTTIHVNGGTGGAFTQTLPLASTLDLANATITCGAGVSLSYQNGNPNEILYTISSGVSVCTVTANFSIPCSVTPIVTGNGQFLSITHLPTTTADTLSSATPTVANPYTFQVSIPKMNIVDFSDDAVLPNPPGFFGANTPRNYLVSPNHHRSFSLLVSYGNVHELEFTIAPESEIKLNHLLVHPVNAAGSSVGNLALFLPGSPNGAPVTYHIPQYILALLFTGSTSPARDMVFGERLVVTEYFDVVGCTPAIPDSTSYSLSWACPSESSTCDSVSEQRAIEVETSLTGMTPFEDMPGLDLCGLLPSDIVFSFVNGVAEAGKFPGSAMKSLHQIEFSVNLDVITFTGIALEGQRPGGSTYSIPIPANGLHGFYNYNATTHRITLDFDQLNAVQQGSVSAAQPLSSLGPLVNGFIPETPTAIYNEIVDGGKVAIRFQNALFHCLGNQGQGKVFYPTAGFAAGFGFADWPKPADGFLFVGQNGNDGFFFNYTDMCGPLPLSGTYDRGNLHNHMPVTAIGDAVCLDCGPPGGPGGMDLQPQNNALLDFYYKATGDNSPFIFGGPLSGNPYFACATHTAYRVILTVPIAYALDLSSVNYFPDPNDPNVSYPMTPASSATSATDTAYTFTTVPAYVPGLGASGRVTAKVKLVNCPPNHGGYDEFSLTNQAICNGCNACAYTTTSVSAFTYEHCHGGCGQSSANQQTSSFDIQRRTLGWTSSAMTQHVTPGPGTGIKTGRVYGCDEIEVNAEGTIVPGSANTALAFRIGYTSVPGVNYQFFEFVSGELGYKDALGTAQSFTLAASADLGSTFNGGGGWPTTGSSPILWINFHNSAFLTTIQNSAVGAPQVPLKLHLILRVRPMTGVAAGFYQLQPLEGQYWTSAGASCDPFHGTMAVLNVVTSKRAEIVSAPYASEFEGWPFSSGICDRRFLIGTSVLGGLFGLDDFPNGEFRAIVHWPDLITLKLPPGVHFKAADFTAFHRAGAPPWPGPPGYPVISSVSVGGGGETVTFSGYQDNGAQLGSDLHPWPFLDKNGNSIDLLLRGSLINDCPATDALGSNPIPDSTLEFPFTNNVYTTDLGCRMVNGSPESLPYSAAPLAVDEIAVTTLTPIFHVTSTPLTVTGIKYFFNAWGHSSIHNAWIHFTSTGLTVTAVRVNGNNATKTTTGDYWEVGTINSGTPAQIEFDFTFIGCNPGTAFSVTADFGYSCAPEAPGYAGTGYPPDVAPCDTGSYEFKVFPELSALQMAVTPPPPVVPGDPCNQYVYKARLTSTGLADVEHPKLTLTLPFGMTITTPSPYLTSGGASGFLPAPTATVLNEYVFDINQAYNNNGIPPTPAYIDLKFTVMGACGVGANSYATFHAQGDNVCGGPVNCPDYTDTHACRSPINCAEDKTVECNSTWSFDPPTPGCCLGPLNINIAGPDVTILGTCPQNRSVTRTWTASDQCGNTITCSQTVTVVDSKPPVITCNGLPITTIECPATPSFLPPTVRDDCDPSPVVTSIDQTTTGPCSGSYSVTRTWTAADHCGNSATCSQTIIVADTTPPHFTSCLPYHYAAGNISDDFNGPQPTSPSPGLLARLTQAGVATKGFDDCAALKTVAHTFASLPPCITAATLTIRLKPCGTGPGCTTDTLGFSFTDALGHLLAGGWTRSLGTGAGSPPDLLPNDWCSYPGGQLLTFDLAALPLGGGSLLAYLNQYHFLDVICADDTAVDYMTLDILSCCSPATGKTVACGTAWSFDVPTAFDTCCNASALITDLGTVITGPSCAQVHTKTWRATDCCGNSATCSQAVTVVDTTPPIITCAGPQTNECPVVFPLPTVSDACDPNPTLLFTDVITPGPCPQSHDVTRTWTAIDFCGNQASCSQTITVVDTTPPVFSCISPLTVECSHPIPPVVVQDDCDPNPVVTFTDVITPGACPQEYSITRTWSATDHCNNTATCIQTILIVDTTAPVVVCAGPKNIECPAVPVFAPVAVKDACDPAPIITFTTTTTPGNCPQSYSVTRTWTATDHCGNQGSCSQTITVVDTTPPIITCAGPMTNECPATPNFPPPMVHDACDPNPVITSVNVTTPGNCAQNYSITRTWTATDHCGNHASCSQTITVVDTAPPVAAAGTIAPCYPTQLAAETAAAAATTATDNCSSSLTRLAAMRGNPCNAEILVTVIDECGNRSVPVIYHTRIDGTPPVLACPVNKHIECDQLFVFDTPTAVDNCDPAPVVSQMGVDVSTQNPDPTNCKHYDYTIKRTWVATDSCGNVSAPCTQTITVADTQPPLLTCPATIVSRECNNCRPIYFSVLAFDNCTGPLVPACVPPSGSTFCAGITTVSCTATDICGHVGICSFQVDVINQPVIWQSRQLGQADCYQLPTDYVPKSALLATLAPGCWKLFDDPQVNCFFGASFMQLPADLTCAQLWIRMKPNCADIFPDRSPNDTITIGLNPPVGTGPATPAWNSYIGGGSGQTPSLIPGVWCEQTDCNQLFSFNLANMPHPPTSLLPAINALHQLDIAVENDTTVDYARLCYCYCRTRPWWWGWEWDLENATLATGYDFASVSPSTALNYKTNFSVTLAPGAAHGIRLGLRALTLGDKTNAVLTVTGRTTLDRDADAIRITRSAPGAISFGLASVRSNVTQIQMTLRRGTNAVCQGTVAPTSGSNFLNVLGNAALLAVTATDDGNTYRFTLDGQHSVTGSLCSSNTADEITVSLLTRANPQGNLLASLTLGAALLDEIQLANAAVQVSGSFPTITGDGVASADGNQVSISPHDINSTNPVGFSLGLPAVSTTTISIQPWFRYCWLAGVEGKVDGVLHGQVDGQTVAVGHVSFSHTGAVWKVRGDFSGIGATGQRFQLFNLGTLVADTAGRLDAVVSAAELPSAWVLSSDQGAAPVAFTWPAALAFSVDGIDYIGDELRLSAVEPISSISALTSLDVSCVGVEALVLSSVAPSSPALNSASAACLTSEVTVIFSLPLDISSASESSNYHISDGVDILSATPSLDGKTVTLATSPLISGNIYTLSVQNLADPAGHLVAPASTVVFSCADTSYTINIIPGYNLIANQLDNGGNIFGATAPPDGTFVYQFDPVTGGYRLSSFIDGAWEGDSFGAAPIINPGEGAFLESPVAFVLTVTGTPHVPVLPILLRTGLNLVSRQINQIGTYENTVGLPPANGTVVYRFNPGGDPGLFVPPHYSIYSYLNGWEGDNGGEPLARIGESFWIRIPDRAPLAIISQPQSQRVVEGSNATLRVTATNGVPPLHYQWRFNGADRLGRTNSTYTISNAQTNDAGAYTVVVSDAVTSITSDPATITVVGPPIAFSPNGSGLSLNWPNQTYKLQQANSPVGVWTDVPGATSPYPVFPNSPGKFYRSVRR